MTRQQLYHSCKRHYVLCAVRAMHGLLGCAVFLSCCSFLLLSPNSLTLLLHGQVLYGQIHPQTKTEYDAGAPKERPSLDSLLKLLAKAQADTAKILLLCEISSDFTNFENNYRRGEEYALQAVALAESIGSKRHLMLALKALAAAGSVAFHPSPSDAVVHFERALALAVELGDRRNAAYILRWWIYSLRDRIADHRSTDAPVSELSTQAFALIERCKRFADTLNDDRIAASCFAAEGVIRAALADYPRAIAAMLSAEQLYLRGNDPRRAAYCVGYIGTISLLAGDYPRALQSHLQAMRVADSLGASLDKGVYLVGIGDVYAAERNLTQALRHYAQAEPMLERYGTRKEYVQLLEKIGALYKDKQDFDKARRYYQKAHLLRLALGSEYGIYQLNVGSLLLAEGKRRQALDTLLAGYAQYGDAMSGGKYKLEFLLQIGHCYVLLGDYRSALGYATEALQKAEEKHLAESMMEAARLLYEIYKNLGQPTQALACHEKYLALKDSLFSREHMRMMASLESRAILDQRQATIALLQREREINRWIQYGLGASVLAVLVLVSVLLARQQKKQTNGALLEQRNAELAIAINQLQRKNEELDEASHFKMKMLSMASHDLKNPLSGIIGAAEAIKREAEKGSRIEKLADRINTIGWRMFTLIADLLDTAARDMGKIELAHRRFDFASLVNTVIKRYQRDAQAKRQMILSDGMPELWMIGDRERLGQVVDNLISNAIKYSPPDTSISVLWSANSGIVQFAVRDQGPGLSEEDKEKAFNFFQRLSAQPTGGESSSGVGLAIVRQIVELHGGRVWCESEVGHGATFIVEVPQLQPEE